MQTSRGKILFWVKFVDQSSGNTINTYFLARSLSHLDEEIADILEVKVIHDVDDLTKQEVDKKGASDDQ